MSTTHGFRNVCLIGSFRATLKLDPFISLSENTTSNEKRVGLIRPCIWRMQTDMKIRSMWHCFKADKRSLSKFCDPLHLIRALCVALSSCNVCCQITDSELTGACLTSHWLRCT